MVRALSQPIISEHGDLELLSDLVRDCDLPVP